MALNKNAKKLILAMLVCVVVGWAGLFFRNHRIVLVVYQPDGSTAAVVDRQAAVAAALNSQHESSILKAPLPLRERNVDRAKALPAAAAPPSASNKNNNNSKKKNPPAVPPTAPKPKVTAQPIKQQQQQAQQQQQQQQPKAPSRQEQQQQRQKSAANANAAPALAPDRARNPLPSAADVLDAPISPAIKDLPKPVVRPLWEYHDDGINDCWEGPRDFEKRPVVVYQSGADSSMQLPPLKLCDVPCFATGNGGMTKRADVFPAWESVYGGKVCAYQKTAWITMENYEHRSPPNADYRSTVSLKSEVPVPYLSWFDFEPLRPMNPEKAGTAMATAFISNCGASERRSFVEALMRNNVSVHSFGGCLHNREEGSVSSLTGKYERKMDIMSKYKFHLAFENSRTPDYVTEKFFQTLEAGTIPVYFGAPNIEDFAPAPGSVLRVDSYGGAEAVAKEMHRLANDPVAYNKMLAWKTEGPSDQFKALFDLNAIHSVCRLCLKTADDYALKYGDAHDFLAPEHRGVARNGMDHVLVRERNNYYFYVVPLAERTVAGLHAAVLAAFDGYVPLFARHESLVKLRKFTGKFRIHRVYPAYQSVHDTMYADITLKTNADVAKLEAGARLEAIFLESN